jgi:hypothetical protein
LALEKSLTGQAKLITLTKTYMAAKRETGIGKHKKSHSHKTKKRLEIKWRMLAARADKRKYNN